MIAVILALNYRFTNSYSLGLPVQGLKFTLHFVLVRLYKKEDSVPPVILVALCVRNVHNHTGVHGHRLAVEMEQGKFQIGMAGMKRSLSEKRNI